jgi:hypothetical protein
MILGLLLAALGFSLYRDRASFRELLDETGVAPASKLAEDMHDRLPHRVVQGLQFALGALGLGLIVGGSVGGLRHLRSRGLVRHRPGKPFGRDHSK